MYAAPLRIAPALLVVMISIASIPDVADAHGGSTAPVAGYFTYFVISLAALWQGLILIGTLRDGFVLIALPAFVARTATTLCLSCGAALLLLAVRLAELPHAKPRTTRKSTTDESDPE
jgi:hypothetical protein